MEKTKEVQRSELLRFLEGHRKANELTKAEKRIRLSQLTEEESLHEYDALCGIWEANPKKERTEMPERQRISFLLERRSRFNKAGDIRRK